MERKEHKKANLAAKLADWLAETEEPPRNNIAILVEHCEAGFLYATCIRAFKKEATGGMQRRGGKGRRTLGGVFFALVKGKLGRERFDGLMKSQVPEWVREIPPPQSERLGRCPSLAIGA